MILDGSGSFEIDGETIAVAADDYLRVDPAARRVVQAGGDGIRFVVVGAKPRPAYDGRSTL